MMKGIRVGEKGYFLIGSEGLLRNEVPEGDFHYWNGPSGELP